MKVTAIICAAGKGERAGFDKNKLLVPLHGAPVLYHTLKKFNIPEIDEIIVTSSKCDFEEISAIASAFKAEVVIGGNTRTESVKKAIAAANGEIVLIHDGARPFVSQKLIRTCIDEVKTHRSAICAINASDTAVYYKNSEQTRLDRNSLYLLQTPQAFFTEDIKKAYRLAGNKIYTDDSAVYAEFIAPPHFIEGETENKKLTYKSDFSSPLTVIAESGKVGFGSTQSVDAQRQNVSDNNVVHAETNAIFNVHVGFGIDVHVFGEGNFVTLGGVKIGCDKRLIAHSDGDVLVHSVMDALLSAAGLKDIGHYFPDTDEKFADADSMKMLAEVVKLIKNVGYAPLNVSISVQAEKPKLAKHIERIKENLSGVLKISAENIAVAAGTSEGLGFVGEGLGITSYCIATLKNL